MTVATSRGYLKGQGSDTNRDYLKTSLAATLDLIDADMTAAGSAAPTGTAALPGLAFAAQPAAGLYPASSIQLNLSTAVAILGYHTPNAFFIQRGQASAGASTYLRANAAGLDDAAGGPYLHLVANNHGAAGAVGKIDYVAYGSGSDAAQTNMHRWLARGATDGSVVTQMTLESAGHLSVARGVIRSTDGAVGAPAFAFNTEATTGLYLRVAGALAIAVGGTRRVEFSSTTSTMTVIGSANNYTLDCAGSSTTGQSYGPRFSSGTNSADEAFRVNNYNNGSTYFTIRGDGVATFTAALLASGGLAVTGSLGLFGTAATTKQTVTGSRGGNAALASLLTALAAYGLVTDSSS